jgi:hypothetical protein
MSLLMMFTMIATGCLQLGQTKRVLGMSAATAWLFPAVRGDPYLVTGRASPVQMISACPPKSADYNGANPPACGAFVAGIGLRLGVGWRPIRRHERVTTLYLTPLSIQ